MLTIFEGVFHGLTDTTNDVLMGCHHLALDSQSRRFHHDAGQFSAAGSSE